MSPFTKESVDRALLNGGDLYTFDSILRAIDFGEMQSHTGPNGDWVVTRICNYPNKVALEIVLAVGTFEGLRDMEPALEEFARDQGCDVMIAFGRVGWEEKMTPGWRKFAAQYIRSL